MAESWVFRDCSACSDWICLRAASLRKRIRDCPKLCRRAPSASAALCSVVLLSTPLAPRLDASQLLPNKPETGAEPVVNWLEREARRGSAAIRLAVS